jgi:hypothetical protein
LHEDIHYIAVYGGHDKYRNFIQQLYLSDLFRLNLETFIWTKLSSLNEGPMAYYQVMNYYEGSLYLWGGQNAMNELYRYEFATEKWNIIKTSGTEVNNTENNGICIYNDSLYSLSGYHPKINSRVDSIFKINLKSGLYEVEEITISHRDKGDGSFGYGCMHNNMYMFGGYSTQGDRNTLLSINLDETQPNLTLLSKHFIKPAARHGHAMDIYDDKLYIYGGKSGKTR